MKLKNRTNQPSGFSLIVVVTIMVLLSLIAVGLLSLSTTTLRKSSHLSAKATANSNARLALALAIADLQKYAGDDRRITADANIDSQQKGKNFVGIWESWSPNLSANPTQTAPDYDSEKNSRFLRW